MSQIELTFRSALSAPRDRVWAWVTSVEGISRELSPIVRMTTPRGVKRIGDVPIEPGKPLFRSWILLFGIIPIDRSDLTLRPRLATALTRWFIEKVFHHRHAVLKRHFGSDARTATRDRTVVR